MRTVPGSTISRAAATSRPCPRRNSAASPPKTTARNAGWNCNEFSPRLPPRSPHRGQAIHRTPLSPRPSALSGGILRQVLQILRIRHRDQATGKPPRRDAYRGLVQRPHRFCIATNRPPVADKNWGRRRRPVINVSWEDAQDYCVWLSAQTGYSYRLPSEAEWEYACRAGSATPYHWGSTITLEQANYDGGAKGENRHKTIPVDELQPNAFGLYQMPGNVDEWCEDVWHPNYEGASQDGSARTGTDTRRVSRGGSIFQRQCGSARLCCSASRYCNNLDHRGYSGSYGVGFRCALVHCLGFRRFWQATIAHRQKNLERVNMFDV